MTRNPFAVLDFPVTESLISPLEDDRILQGVQVDANWMCHVRSLEMIELLNMCHFE